MRNSWAKKILDATLQDLSLYAFIDQENCLQRLANVRQAKAGAAISNPTPGKKETFCALLITCGQKFEGLDVATIKSLVRNLEKESWVLQREIDCEEEEEKKKKLNEEFANMEELKRALRVLEAEALYRKKLQQQLEELNAWLEKLQREIEEEKKKLAIILDKMFANLKNSTDVYSIELEPGVHLGHVAYGEIFALLEDVTRDYFNNIISGSEFHEKKQDIVSNHVNSTIENLIILKPSADEQARLRGIKNKRIDIIVKEVSQQVNEKMRADVNYTNAVASQAKVMTQKEAIKSNTQNKVSVKNNIQKEVSISIVKKDNTQKEVSISTVKKDNTQKEVNKDVAQGDKNISESEPYSTSSTDKEEKKSSLSETSKKVEEESKLLLQKEIKEGETISLPKKQKKKSLCSVHDNHDSFFNKEKKAAIPSQPANDLMLTTSQIKKAS